MAWEMVQANRGSGGVDGQSLDGFAAQLDQQLERLQRELQEDVYRPQPVRQVQIPKAGKRGEFRTLGIPTIYDRVCQQALLNRLEPIFEPVGLCRPCCRTLYSTSSTGSWNGAGSGLRGMRTTAISMFVAGGQGNE
jgi:retron-type reverse transcriptase